MAGESMMEEPLAPPQPIPATIKEKQTRAMRAMREEEDQDIRTFLEGFSSVPDFKASLYRLAPERFQDVPTKGLCCTYTTVVTEEQVKDEWGGGDYKIQVHKSGGHGSIQGSKRFQIAGNPKLKDMTNAQPAATGGAALADRAMAVMERTNQEERDRARQAEKEARSHTQAPGFDPMLLKVLTDPLNRQLDQMAADKRDLENRMAALLQKMTDISNRPREESLGDKLVHTMMDKESSRIEAIRLQHESELRAVREVQKMETERIHAMYKDQIASLERSHEREVKGLERSREDSVMSLKNSYEMRIEALKESKTSLDRDLTKSEARVAALETVKVKTPLEQLQDAAAFKDTLEDLGFAGKEEEGGSTMERIFSGVLNSEIAKGLAGRLSNPAVAAAAPAVMGAVAQAQPTPEEQQAILAAVQAYPLNKPFKLPNGQAIIKRQMADGRIAVMPYVKKEPTPEQAEARKRAKAVNIDPASVEIAVALIEKAIENNIDPGDFAATARTMLDKNLMALLRQKGVDFFLTDVAKPSDHSPLHTQAGRNWVRKVGKILIGDATPEAEPVAEEVVDE